MSQIVCAHGKLRSLQVSADRSRVSGKMAQGQEDKSGLATPLTSASSFVPQEYMQTLTADELDIVVSVVQRVLDGELPKTAIAEVRASPQQCMTRQIAIAVTSTFDIALATHTTLGRPCINGV